MEVLLVFAHPEPRSLNGALRDVAIKELEAHGHEVRVSDLYADGWKSEVDRADFPSLLPGRAAEGGRGLRKAFRRQRADRGCQSRAGEAPVGRRPDPPVPLLVVLHAGDPQGLGRPGYAYGFAYGVGEHSDSDGATATVREPSRASARC